MARGESYRPGAMEACTHGVPKGMKCDACDKEREKFASTRAEVEKRQGPMTELVNRLVFGQPEPNPEKMLQMIAEYRATLPPNATERELAILDYMEGTAHHTKSSDLLLGFGSFVRKSAPGRNAAEMSRQELDSVYSAWAERDAYESAERQALESYVKAADESWIVNIGRTGRNTLDTGNAALQKMDLEWRAAERIVDGPERDAKLNGIMKRMEVMVANMSEAGKGAEYKVILMVRNMARRREIDHAVNIEHTLPRQDLHDKQQQDLVLRIAPITYGIQQKNFTVSANDPEYNARQESDLKQKMRERNLAAAGAILDSYQVKDAYEEYRSGGTREQRKLIEALIGNLPADAQKAAEKLFAPEPKKERVRANDADMQKFLDVPRLVRLGYLPGPTNDVKALLAAKKEALEKLKALKPNRDDLSDSGQGLVDRLRKAA